MGEIISRTTADGCGMTDVMRARGGEKTRIAKVVVLCISVGYRDGESRQLDERGDAKQSWWVTI